ncbi:MAG TPA: hypothetical protein VMT20_03960 [Terriglobia bacterium]|nr:hypothetical protein [Terriglobia bacterium]
MILCDRTFYPDGQLHYPVSPKPDAPWVPEVFGNAILVNGKLLPYLEVEPRGYRFRVLNGSNGRFYHLSLANGQTSTRSARTRVCYRRPSNSRICRWRRASERAL